MYLLSVRVNDRCRCWHFVCVIMWVGSEYSWSLGGLLLCVLHDTVGG